MVPQAPGPGARLNFSISMSPSSTPLSFLSRMLARLPGRRADAQVDPLPLEQQIAVLAGQKDQLIEERETLRAAVNERDTRIAALESDLAAAREAVTAFDRKVRRQVIEEVAACGISVEQLPTGTGAFGSNEDVLREELKTCQDPVRKGKICAELAAQRTWN